MPQLYGRLIRIISYNSDNNLSFAVLPPLYDSLVRIINYNSGQNVSFAFAFALIRCRREFFSRIFEVKLCSWSFIYIRTRIRQLMDAKLAYLDLSWCRFSKFCLLISILSFLFLSVNSSAPFILDIRSDTKIVII